MSPLKHADAIRRYYATDENLRIHDKTYSTYTVPKIDFVRWTLGTLDWRGGETVLDIGAGRGRHFTRLTDLVPDIRYYALDLSQMMLVNHPAGGGRLTHSDAMRLPYADHSFDVVMANHVLYHLDDIDGGLAEIKRVLKPDGRLLAATDSIHTLPELQILLRRAIVLLTSNGAAQVHPPDLPSDAFALENGTRMLARHFFAVMRHDLPSQLVFTAADPAMDYLESMRGLRQHSLPDDVEWDNMMLMMRQQIDQLIRMMGKLEISRVCGALIASDRGGFIGEFVERGQRD